MTAKYQAINQKQLIENEHWLKSYIISNDSSKTRTNCVLYLILLMYNIINKCISIPCRNIFKLINNSRDLGIEILKSMNVQIAYQKKFKVLSYKTRYFSYT